MKIPIDSIVPNPEQPRQEIPAESLAELAESIRTHGLINAISVEDGGKPFVGQEEPIYILIDGERRWRAAKLAGLTEIEATIRPGLNGSGQVERLVLATVANLQRADMNALEKAIAFQKLVDMGMSHAEVARTVGLSVASVDNYLLILRLPDSIQALVRSGALNSGGRAMRALLDIDEPAVQIVVAQAAAKRNMTEQGVIALARRVQQGKKLGKRARAKAKEELSPYWNGRWNMIAQAGNPKMDDNLRQVCVTTCQQCALFDYASPKICIECPAVFMLRKLIEACDGQ